MKTAVKLFKIEADYGGEPRSGFIYAANENDAAGLFVNEWTWGTHDDVPISTTAIFVADTKADVNMDEGQPVARFLTGREKAAWHKKLEPETYQPKRPVSTGTGNGRNKAAKPQPVAARPTTKALPR